MTDPLLTVEDLARIMGTTPGTGYVQRYRGVEPWSLGIKVGRNVRYRQSDIEAFFDSLAAEQRQTSAMQGLGDGRRGMTITRGILPRLQPYKVTRFPTGAIDQSHPLRWSVFSSPGGNTPKSIT